MYNDNLMVYDPTIHHRRSIRLKEYDYFQSGYYFVTICTHNRQILFDNKFVIEMVEKWWYALPTKFSNVQIDVFIVMPDHIHGIINIIPMGPVGANQCVCPLFHLGRHTGLPLRVSIFNIIQWYKTMTTNEYMKNVKTLGWVRFNGKLWQHNYYERIIRNENELNRIREYIINNPIKHKKQH